MIDASKPASNGSRMFAVAVQYVWTAVNCLPVANGIRPESPSGRPASIEKFTAVSYKTGSLMPLSAQVLTLPS